MVMGENTTHCISHFCEDVSMEWKLSFELCQCDSKKEATIKMKPKNTPLEHNKPLEDLKSDEDSNMIRWVNIVLHYNLN